jgi:glycosidase
MDPNGDGDPSDGIDGWRLDVAEKVPLGFWREYRKWVRSINPEAYITGEVWWEDWEHDKMFNAEPWLRGDAFDAVMNYRWARETCRFFKGRQTAITPSQFARRLDSLRNDYRLDANFVLMNLLDSHDTDRLGSMIVNADTRYDHRVGASDNSSYDVRKPNAPELQIQKLMVLFQMTYLGAPMIYYGDEAGMWGGDDPDERKPMLWEDLQFEKEASHPYGHARPTDPNEFNADLFAWHKKMIALRKSQPALQRGSYATLLADDSLNVFAFVRQLGKEDVAVIINNSAHAQRIEIKLPSNDQTAGWADLLSHARVVAQNGIAVLRLDPKTALVLGRKMQ